MDKSLKEEVDESSKEVARLGGKAGMFKYFEIEKNDDLLAVKDLNDGSCWRIDDKIVSRGAKGWFTWQTVLAFQSRIGRIQSSIVEFTLS